MFNFRTELNWLPKLVLYSLVLYSTADDRQIPLMIWSHTTVVSLIIINPNMLSSLAYISFQMQF